MTGATPMEAPPCPRRSPYDPGMEMSEETTYDASVGEVYAVETDEAEYLSRFAEGGDRDVEMLECGPDGDGWLMRNRRVITIDLPGFAQKALKPTNTIEHTVRFGPEVDGRQEGVFTIDVQGAPVRTDGTIVFEDLGDGHTRHTVRCDVQVKIPLIGGKIANWAKGDVAGQIRREFEYTRRRIVERR